MENNKQSNFHILQKNESRLAAVKALYSNTIVDTKKSPSYLVKEMIEVYKMEIEELHKSKIDEKFFKKLVLGAISNQDAIVSSIDSNLNEKWKIERLSNLILAILVVAIFELKELKNTDKATIINEYVNISQMFFDEKEVGFVNGILDKVSKQVRETTA